MLNSERMQKDACTFFGIGNSQKAFIDFIIPETENCSLKHFVIQYAVSKNAYFIKDLKSSNGTFARLDHAFVFFVINYKKIDYT